MIPVSSRVMSSLLQQTIRVITAFPDHAPIPPFKPIKWDLCLQIVSLSLHEGLKVDYILAVLQTALGYVGYNGESIAFEILCDYICEYDISIMEEEYNEAVRLVLDIGLDLGEGPFKNLLRLKL